jgi:hypothetical protein
VRHASQALRYLEVVHDLVHAIGPDLLMSVTIEARECSAYTVKLAYACSKSRRFTIVASRVVSWVSGTAYLPPTAPRALRSKLAKFFEQRFWKVSWAPSHEAWEMNRTRHLQL